MFLSDFYFEPSMFVDSLKYMGIGMVGIFAVMLVIILSVYLLNYLSNKFGNSTKKLTKSNKIIIVVLIIALFGVSLVVYLTKDRYYECSEYLTISTENGEIVVTDELDNYDYYIGRPTSTNDLHGMGAFVLMCNAYDSLINEG